MAEKNRPPEDEQPLARPVHDQRLARPVGGEQEEEEVARAAAEQQETPRTEEQQREAPGSQQEKGLVEEATVEKAREKGLGDKADEAIDKARNKNRRTLIDRLDARIDAR